MEVEKIRLPGWVWNFFALCMSPFLIIPNWELIEDDLSEAKVLYFIFFAGAVFLITDVKYFVKVIKEEGGWRKFLVILRVAIPFWYVGCYVFDAIKSF